MENTSNALRIEGGALLEMRTATREKEVSEFFGFAQRGNRREFFQECSDCSLFDIAIASHVKDWPTRSGSPPNPALFANCFDILLRNLVGQRGVLTLFIKSLDPQYFDELTFIKDYLIKERGRFLLLSRQGKDERYPYQRLPDLFFEWTHERAKFMVSEWFMSPQVSIEGYVSESSILPEIILSSSLVVDPQPRRLLYSLIAAFRLWPDFNGISILTSKLTAQNLIEMLDNEQLRIAIQGSL